MSRPDTVIVFVSQDGVGLHGERFDVRADPHLVVAGLAHEIPVVLHRPDGSIAMGTRIVALVEAP